jgi:hypothetical protein
MRLSRTFLLLCFKKSVMSEDQFKALTKAIEGLNRRFDAVDNRLDLIELSVKELKEDVRKVLKFIAIDNADFPRH